MTNRTPWLVAAVLACLILTTGVALAHPLGNFTTNLHLGLHFSPGQLNVTLVVDMAEIPAFRERRAIAGSETDYVAQSCADHGRAIALLLDGRALALESGDGSLTFPPGEGGLDTLRLECPYSAVVSSDGEILEIENRVYEDRRGWSELVVSTSNVVVDTSLPAVSSSETLTSYPSGPTLVTRTGTVLFRPGAVRVESVLPASPTQASLAERIGSGIARQTGVLALAAALALGAGHALAPGHGKTLMAAYLVGRRGSPRTAVGLGLSVALSHTIGVGILGLITALTTSAFQPDSVYPWLSLVSAAIVTSIGVVMLFRALTTEAHTHDHDHLHDHEHSPAAATGGWRSLAALGLAGGLVPSASAVVLLLGAIAQGNAWWGLILVAGFGLGMSASLIGAGLLAVGAQRWGWTRLRSDRWRQAWQKRVPLVGGLAVTLIGLWLVFDTGRRFFA